MFRTPLGGIVLQSHGWIPGAHGREALGKDDQRIRLS